MATHRPRSESGRKRAGWHLASPLRAESYCLLYGRTAIGFIEEIDDEVGPISDAERALVERELDLAAAFTAGIAGRLPENASAEEKHQAITELLHEDPQLAATFLELIEVSRSNRASPMASIKRLEERID